MTGALRALLEGVIDYAGLFPPAKLPVGEAVADYLAIVEGADKWIVDRFACSTGKLRDLSIELNEHPEEPFIPISVIGGSQADKKHWKQGLEHDGAEMTRFQSSADALAEIQAYEIRLPDHQHVGEYVSDLKAFANIDVFVELPWGAEMADSLAIIAEMDAASVKARTGGLERSAFPSAPELAAFIRQCVQLDLTFKLTAGLHHALPVEDPATGATMHGFLNVLFATALCLAEDLSTKEVESLLLERDPSNFRLALDTIAWQGHEAARPDLEGARTLFPSFGSCSVREPIEDLSKLGLIEKVSR